MLNAALTDERYASSDQTTGSASHLESNKKFMPVPSAKPYNPPIKTLIPLGLRSGVTLDWTQDGKRFPEQMVQIILKFHEFEKLEDNWDGYGARPLNDRVVLPAFELIISRYARQYPSLVLLPDGGIGLRWVNGTREVEIDLEAKGGTTGFYADAATGEVFEIDEDSEPDGVSTLLDRYFSH